MVEEPIRSGHHCFWSCDMKAFTGLEMVSRAQKKRFLLEFSAEVQGLPL